MSTTQYYLLRAASAGFALVALLLMIVAIVEQKWIVAALDAILVAVNAALFVWQGIMRKAHARS